MKKKIIYPLLVSFFVYTIFIWVMRGEEFSFSNPWAYSGDGLFFSSLIKSIIDTGWFLTNDFLGFPGGYQTYDFYQTDILGFFIVYIESFFIHNYVLALNIFYFITFLLPTFSSLYVCKKLGINTAFSLLISILFAFSPYHFFRGEQHLQITSYFVIPLYLLIMMSAFLKEKEGDIFSNAISLSKKQFCFLIFFAFFLSLSGSVYYLFFGCYFLVIAAFYMLINQNNKRYFFRVFAAIILILFGFLISAIPCFIEWFNYGTNSVVPMRNAEGSEVYGLKIIQLFLPTSYSGFSFFKSLAQHYNQTAPLVNENQFSYIGIIADTGFLILLFVSLFRVNKWFEEKIYLLSTLNLAAVLFGTIGGFGAIFSYTVSHMIRGYNRISIFIMYFSLVAFSLLIQALLKKLQKEKITLISWLLAGILLLFGLYDQLGGYRNEYKINLAKFSSDEVFIDKIEKKFPTGANIFQLPYFSFPERYPDYIYHMQNNDAIRGYLHSHRLKWSYGAMNGRPVAQWQEQVSQKDLPSLLQDIIIANFSGLYIDRNGYEDNGVSLESQLNNILQVEPIVSPNNDLSFFDLRPYAKKILTNISSTSLSEKKREIFVLTHLQISWKDGFSILETRPEEPNFNWRWSDKKGILSLVNMSKTPIHVDLTFQLRTAYRDHAHVILESEQIGKQNFSVNELGTNVSIPLELQPGITNICFSTDALRVNAPMDTRSLYFQVDNFKWKVT